MARHYIRLDQLGTPELYEKWSQNEIIIEICVSYLESGRIDYFGSICRHYLVDTINLRGEFVTVNESHVWTNWVTESSIPTENVRCHFTLVTGDLSTCSFANLQLIYRTLNSTLSRLVQQTSNNRSEKSCGSLRQHERNHSLKTPKQRFSIEWRA